MMPNWNNELIAVATAFHGLAILSTLFRLWYRWRTARLWWEDAWALVALLADIMCLVVTWLEQPIPGADVPSFFVTGNWILSLAFPTVIWASRASILISIVRVSQPVGTWRHVAVGICVTFGAMWLGLVVYAQTVTDGIADLLLTGLPVLLLRDMRLGRKRRILLLSTFSASMIVNVVTVLQAVVLLRTVITSGTVIIGHVKYAVSLIVCNLLVIVTWIYGVMNKGKTGLEDSQFEASKVELTTVDVDLSRAFSQEASNFAIATKSSSWSFRGPGTSSAVTGAQSLVCE